MHTYDFLIHYVFFIDSPTTWRHGWRRTPKPSSWNIGPRNSWRVRKIGNRLDHYDWEHRFYFNRWKVRLEWFFVHETFGLKFISFFRPMDTNFTPLGELERWQRRHRTLTGLTEQLKGKECKSIIGFLIMGKSKLLKRWKAVDVA